MDKELIVDVAVLIVDARDNGQNAAESFLVDLICGLTKSDKLAQRVRKSGLSVNALDVYKRFNKPGHSVRDGMIIVNGIGDHALEI